MKKEYKKLVKKFGKFRIKNILGKYKHYKEIRENRTFEFILTTIKNLS
jgi:hypothetical protein